MKSGKSAEAVKAFAELKSKHGGTTVYKQAGAKLEAQIKDMGKTVSNAAMQPNIEKWYVDGELDLDTGVTFLVFWEVLVSTLQKPHAQAEQNVQSAER